MPYYQTVISCLKSFFSFYQFFFEKVVDIAETMSYKSPCRCGGNVDENESHKGVASYRTE